MPTASRIVRLNSQVNCPVLPGGAEFCEAGSTWTEERTLRRHNLNADALIAAAGPGLRERATGSRRRRPRIAVP